MNALYNVCYLQMILSYSTLPKMVSSKLLTGFRMHALLPERKSVQQKKKPCACPDNQSSAFSKLMEYHLNSQINPSTSASHSQVTADNSELDIRIGKASAVMRQLHRSVVLKREFCT